MTVHDVEHGVASSDTDFDLTSLYGAVTRDLFTASGNEASFDYW